MKILILAMLLGIVFSLGQALFAMTSGPADNNRMVKALTWRICLSVGLFAALFVGWKMGAITPHGL